MGWGKGKLKRVFSAGCQANGKKGSSETGEEPGPSRLHLPNPRGSLHLHARSHKASAAREPHRGFTCGSPLVLLKKQTMELGGGRSSESHSSSPPSQLLFLKSDRQFGQCYEKSGGRFWGGACLRHSFLVFALWVSLGERRSGIGLARAGPKGQWRGDPDVALPDARLLFS